MSQESAASSRHIQGEVRAAGQQSATWRVGESAAEVGERHLAASTPIVIHWSIQSCSPSSSAVDMMISGESWHKPRW